MRLVDGTMPTPGWLFGLRALAACERRMGLAKTSWEEEERASALAYMQQGRGAKAAALAAGARSGRIEEFESGRVQTLSRHCCRPSGDIGGI